MSAITNPRNLQVNISSLVGQLSLKRTDAGLAKSIRNLSSGIRVHSGRDDPVGFVAGTAMRTDIVSMNQAVANSQRANAVISTADSSLSHLNSLMNDLRGLVTQAANTGAENPATLAALQQEANSILSAIDLVSATTTLQGRNLIDGSLDFTTYGVDSGKIAHLAINQANFQGRVEKSVTVQVQEPARQAELYYPLGALKSDARFSIGGQGGFQSFNFDQDATVHDIANAVNKFSDATGVAATVFSKSTSGSLGLTSYGPDNDIILTASTPGTEAGNFVVRYTAPKNGNNELSLNVAPGSGNEPTTIEVMLQTQAWEKAAYHYNGYEDGVSNNEFSLLARYAGEEFNDIEFEVNNVYGTEIEPGIELDLKASPKRFVINVSYNENDPTDSNNTTVADLADWIAADSTAGTYFELQHTPPSNGSGPLIPGSAVTQTKQGVDGGAVISTAEQVANLINTSPDLKNPDGTGKVSATLPAGSNGLGTVSPFAEVSYYGDPKNSNYLQFLAPAGSPTIKFVSTPGAPLSVDDSTYPPVYGRSEARIQGLEAGTSFTLKSPTPGPDGDGVGVVFRDSAEESAVFDAERNAVVFSIDFTGRAGDPAREDFSMNDLRRMVANDPFLSSRFSVTPMTVYDPNDPPRFLSENYVGMDAQLGETSGGVISEGSIVVHLETDTNGVVKTTAGDLVKFWNSPSTEEDRAILDRLGISVSSIDPGNADLSVCTTGNSASGTGLLKPTYDPFDANCNIEDGQYPDVIFSSYGSGMSEDYPSATITSRGGLDADFTITAKTPGASYNNCTVRVVSDVTGPVARYNPATRELTIGVSPQNPSSANDVIKLINDDPALSSLFIASRGPGSNGTGFVAVGDRSVLTGGVQPLDGRAEGNVVSANGINASFEITALNTDPQFVDTEILVTSDPNGPSVNYDAQSKQLTIGINPTNPPTAREIVDIINATPEINRLFQASIPAIADGTAIAPTGDEAIRVGDTGTLRIRDTGMSLGAGMLGNSDSQSLGITFHSVEYGSQEFVEVIPADGVSFRQRDGKDLRHGRGGLHRRATGQRQWSDRVDGDLGLGFVHLA